MLAVATLRRTLNLFSAVFLLIYILGIAASKYICSSFKLYYLRKNPQSIIFKGLFHVLFLRRCSTLAVHEHIILRCIILLSEAQKQEVY
jgi:hypothetical protein